MSPVYLRDLGFQRNQPEDREGFSRTRRPGRGHLGHSSGWQNNEGDNINPSIHTPIQWRTQTRGLERHGSTSSDPPTPQGSIPMEHGKRELQPGICHNAVCQTSAKGTLPKKAIKPVESPINTGKL
ncbi:hypothetical protein O181_060877 [Austropuccinia psidii MF-1]|uniref:Uncharacterized protein n=1 Tax=Austropuccinia psidii MF-1 TaxID=1389203 RepID=A0A9Q3EPD4_9BASI|nr:hypothetical protein [Austropuccinia psidii MF-1]